MDNRLLREEHQLAVLIDVENVGLNSIQWLFDQLSDIGRIIIKRAYGDWSSAADKRDQLLELGIEPVQLFRSVKSGKNSSDIRLAIDAVELAYQSPVDTFVIVSSDSDFVPLVTKLRASGKTVIGAGKKAITPRTLVITSDKYYFLDQADASPKKKETKSKKDSLDLLARAIDVAKDEQGRVTGSKLHDTMQRLDPSFDYHALGYATFTKYLEVSPHIKITKPEGPGDIAVELKDADIEQSSENTQSKIDNAWTQSMEKYTEFIPGAIAAGIAAEILGVSRLSISQYKTLQNLLDANELLSSRWRREGNKIIKNK